MIKSYHKHIAISCLVILIGALLHYVPSLLDRTHPILRQPFQPLWTYTSKRQILTTPVLVNDALIFGTYNGSLDAVSVTDGKALWSVDFKDPVFSLTSGTKGVVYAGTGLHEHNTGFLKAIAADTGKILWQTTLNGHLEEAARIDETDSKLWQGAGQDGLWALGLADGKPIWHQPLGHIDATPLLHNGILYVPAQKNETVHETVFYALSANDGKTLWQIEQPGQPWAAPALDKTGQIILTTTGKGQIGVKRPTDRGWAYGVSLDGKILWQTDLPDMPMTPQIYLPEFDQVIYTCKDGSLIALDVKSGTKIWQTKVGASFSQQASLLEHPKSPLVVTTTSDGIFAIVDAKKGTVLYTKKMANTSSSTPVVANKAIYISSAFSITALGYDGAVKAKK